MGLQLYSVRNSLAADPWGTLVQIANAGYKYIEAANHDAMNDPGVGFGVTAKDMRSHLDNLGLSIVGCHINPLDVSILPRALEYQAELGNTQFGCDIEFFPYGDLDYIVRRSETFNQIGELARQHGMRFYYHNHFQEFQRCGDKYVYEIIMENTDPELVKLELDTYWIYRGGQDAIDWIKRYSDRIILLHQKDFPQSSPQPLNLLDGVFADDETINMDNFMERKEPKAFVEIGNGTLPIQEIIDVTGTLPNLEYMILEQDYTELDELDSIRESRRAFQEKFTGTSWE